MDNGASDLILANIRVMVAELVAVGRLELPTYGL
jgi:hypothetical protein